MRCAGLSGGFSLRANTSRSRFRDHTFTGSFEQADIESAPLYPREVMAWTAAALYAPTFTRLLAPGASAQFALRENDYVLGAHKCAGNAQSISRERWVHHTSFLWDFAPRNMALLRLPAKRPEYRADRPHAEFLTPLKHHLVQAAGGGSGESEAADADAADAHPGAALLFPAVLAQLGRAFTLREWALEDLLAERRAAPPPERIGTVDVLL